MIWRKEIPLLSQSALNTIIEERYGIAVANCTYLEKGYSNIHYLIKEKSGAEYMLRLANPAKSHEDFEREAMVLNSLRENNCTVAIPKLVLTKDEDEKTIIPDEGPLTLHLFEYIQGEVCYNWWEVPSSEDLGEIARKYKQLNASLKEIPLIDDPQPFSSYYEVLNELKNDDDWTKKQNIWSEMENDFALFLKKARHLLTLAEESSPNFNRQWIHGDIQTENILFHYNEVSGILDFEHVSCDYEEIDVILSAFRLCKQGKSDLQLEIDNENFYHFIKEYGLSPEKHHLNNEKIYDFWKAFFSLQQSLLYLRNAQRGCWILDYNIGFLPCFNTVVNFKTI